MERHDIAPYQDLSSPDGRLRVHRTLELTRTHGPGRRFSLWLQGCLKRCPGCINQAMLPLEHERLSLVDTDQLVAQIVLAAKTNAIDIEGLTIQGGEPMIQAQNLAHFLEALNTQAPELNVLLFTGYQLDTLKAESNEAINRVLAQVDTLIDGSFEALERDDDIIRGSHNQVIHHLTPQLSQRDFARRGLEHSLDAANSLATETGIRIRT